MADLDKPCGKEFRSSFSCFMKSEAEPKGMDCLEAFKAMQQCFEEHPEVYKDMTDNVEEEEEQEIQNDSTESTGQQHHDESDSKLDIMEDIRNIKRPSVSS